MKISFPASPCRGARPAGIARVHARLLRAGRRAARDSSVRPIAAHPRPLHRRLQERAWPAPPRRPPALVRGARRSAAPHLLQRNQGLCRQPARRRAARHPQQSEREFIEQDQTVSLNAGDIAAAPGHLGPGPHRPGRPSAGHPVPLHQSGAGVHAFIVDTGIRADHVEFTGRTAPRLQRGRRRVRHHRTATATARMWPARWAARPGAWPRAFR